MAQWPIQGSKWLLKMFADECLFIEDMRCAVEKWESGGDYNGKTVMDDGWHGNKGKEVKIWWGCQSIFSHRRTQVATYSVILSTWLKDSPSLSLTTTHAVKPCSSTEWVTSKGSLASRSVMPPTSLASVADSGMGLNSVTRINIKRKREILLFTHFILRCHYQHKMMWREEIRARTNLMNAQKPSVQRQPALWAALLAVQCLFLSQAA